MKITDVAIRDLTPTDKTKDYPADGMPGFKVQVTPKGTKTFYYVFTTHGGRKVRYKIGRYITAISLDAAKKRYAVLAGEVAAGRNPAEEKKQKKKDEVKRKEQVGVDRSLIFRNYLEDVYYPFVEREKKSSARTKYILNYNFAFLMDTRMDKFESAEIEQWREERFRAGVKPATINRAITALKAVVNKAVRSKVIPENPIADVEKSTVEGRGVVRYLSPAERKRLDAALDARDGHLPVIVRLLLNTGMRPVECFGLRWENVDFTLNQLTVLAACAKNNKTRMVPLNTPAREVLAGWYKESEAEDGWLFPSPMTGTHIVSLQNGFRRLMKEAKIKNFRLYDTRHDFASRLATKGVSLYQIAELLGHSNIEITRVYAHLSPEHLQDAVELLG